MNFKVVDWGKIKRGHKVKISREQIKKLYAEISESETIEGFMLPIEKETKE